MATPIQERPWQRIGVDIFTIDGNNYLITGDYHSNYFEIDTLTTSSNS